MFLTKKHLSRRTAIKGLGVTLALPMLEAMVPAVTAQRRTVAGAPRVRLACLEMVHGSAGATRFGAGRNLWSPAAAGRQFDLTPTSLKPLEPFRDYITIVSNTDCRMAEAFTDNEVGGDHNRSSAAYLTQSKPKQTLADSAAMQADIQSLVAKEFLPPLIARAEPGDDRSGPLLKRLAAWDGRMASDESEPLIFVAWLRAFTQTVFEQTLGSDFKSFWNLHPRLLREALAGEDSWCTPDTATQPCTQEARAALGAALDELTWRYGEDPERWQWGQAHALELRHPVLGSLPALSRWFAMRLPLGAFFPSPSLLARGPGWGE